MKTQPLSAQRRAIEGLGRLSDLFEQRRTQLAREAGLTPPQWRLLEEIASDRFMPTLFARRREKSAAAVSKTLRQLIEATLVSVAISSGDRRQRDYKLTASGRRVLERLSRSRARAIEAIWADLEPDALAHFADFSHELADRLEAYVDARSRRGGRRTS